MATYRATQLNEALKLAGFNVSIELTEEEFDSYKDLSPTQMVNKIIQEKNLKPKTNILKILKSIFDVNQKGEFKFPLYNSLNDISLYPQLYMHAFKNIPELISVEGEGVSRVYLWKKNSVPTFADAEDIYNLAEMILNYKVIPAQAKVIEDYINVDFSKIPPAALRNNIIPFHIMEFKLKQLHQRLRSSKKKSSEPVPHETFSRELSRKPFVISQNPDDNNKPKHEETPTNTDLIQAEKELETGVPETILQLMDRKVNYYRKIIKTQNKEMKIKDNYIKQLEIQILNAKK